MSSGSTEKTAVVEQLFLRGFRGRPDTVSEWRGIEGVQGGRRPSTSGTGTPCDVNQSHGRTPALNALADSPFPHPMFVEM